AYDLGKWCKGSEHRPPADLDKVFAHSHGGNVALDAVVRHRIKMNLLVLMNTPSLHRTDEEWGIVGELVGRIVSLQTPWDIVRIADRNHEIFYGLESDGNFPAERVRTYRVGPWVTGHSKITNPKVWKKYNLDDLVA